MVDFSCYLSIFIYKISVSSHRLFSPVGITMFEYNRFMPESCLRALCECLTTSVALLMAVGLSLEARMMGLEAGAMQRGAT